MSEPSLSEIQANPRIPVGISQCLAGDAVRYDGEHQRSALCMEHLAKHLEFVPVCPEIGIGMGTPREPVHLRRDGTGAIHARGNHTATLDITRELTRYAAEQAGKLAGLCGYVFMQRSPSCGLGSVKLHDVNGDLLHREGHGIFAREFRRQRPLLPVEEESRLHDSDVLDHFLTRVFSWRRWQEMQEQGLRLSSLQQFHASHKYLLMACDQQTYRELGQLVAEADHPSLSAIAARYHEAFMTALGKPSSRGNHTNALQHMAGYLKTNLNSAERQTLQALITAYQNGETRRQSVLGLIWQHLQVHPQPYLLQQVYFAPYPADLLSTAGSMDSDLGAHR